ncbi:MAG: exodeoxyribonuclease VII large subunit [Phascolarctobacterium sp.]|nr:exodeoxyribonuclease VII large subunit [Phascolarctobacterium sp.]
MEEKIYSVSEINAFVKNILDHEPLLRNVQVAGEISNFKRYSSGHCYFSLKDETSVLKSVMFKRQAAYLRFEPRNGDKVVVVGRIGVFERDGNYQLYADMLLCQGEGELMMAFEKLKQKLGEEGLFDERRKKEIPQYTKIVGIITSADGAAVRDIIRVARQRSEGVKILIYPVKVQGDGAAGEIAGAIYFFNKHKLADVLIVGRGGGSIEDLWAFNEEITVRAVAASEIPIISAVGHETDFTLCDFAADKRAATPTHAAQLAVADMDILKRRLNDLQQRTRNLLMDKIERASLKLDTINRSWVLQDPERLFEDSILRLDSACKYLTEYIDNRLQEERHKFELFATKLDNLSPLAVLARGFTVTEIESTTVNSVDQVQCGQELKTTLADGKIISVVRSTERR